MNNTVTFLSLVPISLFGLATSLPANANIPQTSIQEILIEGESNKVYQELNQSLNLNFVYLPEIAESVLPTFNIQGVFLDDLNNQVTQSINQNILDFQLLETSLINFDSNDFLNNDGILNGKQFITQEVFTDGNDNSITQQSEQKLTDFIWLDGLTSSVEDKDFNYWLDEILVEQKLDSLQFALQDTLIFGNKNTVYQTIDQTLNSFIFTNNDLSNLLETNIIDETTGFNPVQFTIQETFVDSGQKNSISQTINQVIGDVSFIDASFLTPRDPIIQQNGNAVVEANNSIDFNIDAFINDILNIKNNMQVEATQINVQRIEVREDNNTRIQKNSQELVVSVSEPNTGRITILFLFIMGIVSYRRKTLETK
ncbi:MAG: hypothetical protein QNJ18_16040 [Xenococcaceae cyanobacterium MO_167.B52]|nr:hypothetical protein [Xenococcaceae cyanobacterium MO_167.B52]